MGKKKPAAVAASPHAPLERLLGILSGAWTLNLLHRLHLDGPTRFGELKRKLGRISTKTLTDRLRMLEGEGWLSRHYEPTVPPQVIYALTEKVMELEAVLTELERIAERWYGDAGKKPRRGSGDMMPASPAR